MKKLLTLCLALLAIATAQAQNLMRVHIHNATPVDIETAKIDSLHWEDATTLRIFLTDQTTAAYALQNVDSLTWLLPELPADPLTVGDVTLGSGEQFVINDTLTTAYASDCTVRFSNTVTDVTTPLTIRTATQAPPIQATPEDPDTELVDISLNATTVDVSLDGITELDGFVEIRIPVSVSAEGNIPGAAWYDPATGEWEPINYDYDTSTGEVVIYSNHLSVYTGYEVLYEHTREARLKFHDVPFLPEESFQHEVAEMIGTALETTADWADFVAKYYGVITTCGLDIGYSGLKTCGLKVGLLEKYSKQIGKVGTVLGAYQIMRAGLSGDHETAGLSTMKTLVGKVSGSAANAIGTSVMSAAMCGVAIIDYALNQMWESSWNDRQRLYRLMYEHYYSNANDGLAHHPMRPKQWYKTLLPIFKKGSTDPDGIKKQVEKIVDDYVWEFWNKVQDDEFALYWAEITNLPFSYYGGLNEKTKKDLADWHRAELFNYTLPPVFEAIGREMQNNTYDLLRDEMREWAKTANQKIALQITATNTANASADLSGYRVRFKDLPTTLTDPQKWETTLNAGGQGKIQFRFYPYYTEGVQPVLEVISPNGKIVTEQEITIGEGTNNISIEFVDVTTPMLTLNKEKIEFTADGGKEEITVETNAQSINISISDTWLSASYDAATKIITVTVKKNEKKDDRNAIIQVKASNETSELTDTIYVKQKAYQESTYMPLMERTHYTQAYVRVKATKMNNTGESNKGISDNVEQAFAVDELSCDDNGETMTISGTLETIISQSSSKTVTVTTSCHFLLDKRNGIIREGEAHYKKEEKARYNVLTREVDYSFRDIPIRTKAKSFGDVWAGQTLKSGDYFHIQSIVNDGASYYTEKPMEEYVPTFSFIDVNVNTIGSDTSPHYLNLITESAEGNRFEVEIRLMLPDD